MGTPLRFVLVRTFRTGTVLTLGRLALVGLLSLAAPGGVHAQAAKGSEEGDAAGRASAHFRRGVELFQEGAYRAALVEFNRAHAISPNYRLHYNIAQTQIALLEYLGAVQSYETYLSEGGAEIPEARRNEVETALVALRERIGRISIAVNVAGAEVFVDDQKVGVSPVPATVPVNVGRHRIYARAADGAEASQVLDVAGGDVLELRLDVVAVKSDAPAPVASPGKARGLTTYDKYAIASVSVGGTALAGAVLTGLLARGKSDDLDDALAARPNDARKVNDLRDSTKQLARTTDALAAVGALALAASLTLWLIDDEEERGGTSVSIGPGRITLKGRF